MKVTVIIITLLIIPNEFGNHNNNDGPTAADRGREVEP